MGEEVWNEACLIPTSGIRDDSEEQERRATSALLAVMTAVREFGKAMTQSAGALAGHIETYIEVPFTLGAQRIHPDGTGIRRGSSENSSGIWNTRSQERLSSTTWAAHGN